MLSRAGRTAGAVADRAVAGGADDLAGEGGADFERDVAVGRVGADRAGGVGAQPDVDAPVGGIGVDLGDVHELDAAVAGAGPDGAVVVADVDLAVAAAEVGVAGKAAEGDAAVAGLGGHADRVGDGDVEGAAFAAAALVVGPFDRHAERAVGVALRDDARGLQALVGGGPDLRGDGDLIGPGAVDVDLAVAGFDVQGSPRYVRDGARSRLVVRGRFAASAATGDDDASAEHRERADQGGRQEQREGAGLHGRASV